MGNKASFPTAPIPIPPSLLTAKAPAPSPAPAPCAAPVDLAQARKLVERATIAKGPSECQVNDSQLNMARNDVRQKDEKWEKCYPELALQRKLATAQEETNKFSAERRKERDEANSNYRTKATAVEKLATSAQEFYKTLFEKEKELASFVGKRENLEQLERRERRAFLDNDPQSGTGGAPGVRTSDDRVLLAFWITYGAALLSATVLAIQIYGPQMGLTNLKTKAGAIVLAGIIGYAIPYYFINVFG